MYTLLKYCVTNFEHFFTVEDAVQPEAQGPATQGEDDGQESIMIVILSDHAVSAALCCAVLYCFLFY